MSRGKEIIKEITLSGDTFTLTISIKDDLTPYTKEDKYNRVILCQCTQLLFRPISDFYETLL